MSGDGQHFEICLVLTIICGPACSVGIATEVRAGQSGDRMPVGTRFSAPVQIGPGAHPACCKVGNGSFQGVEAAGVCC